MPQQHPMITIFNMAKFLLNSKYSQKLLSSTLESGQWKHDLASFWAKFKAVDPGHVVSREHSNDLERCIPCLFMGMRVLGTGGSQCFNLVGAHCYELALVHCSGFF